VIFYMGLVQLNCPDLVQLICPEPLMSTQCPLPEMCKDLAVMCPRQVAVPITCPRQVAVPITCLAILTNTRGPLLVILSLSMTVL